MLTFFKYLPEFEKWKSLIEEKTNSRFKQNKGNKRFENHLTKYLMVLGEVKVNFQSQHTSHESDLQHLTLRPSERLQIAKLLEKGIN